MKVTLEEYFELVKLGDVYLTNQERDYYVRVEHKTRKRFAKLKDRPEFEVDGEIAREIIMQGDVITKHEYETGENQVYHPRILH